MSNPPLRSLAASGLAVALAAAGCHVLDYGPRYGPDEIDIFDDLFSVSVADDQHAVAVGYHGAVYYTADAGEIWRKGSSGAIDSLYSVSMADGKSGWAVGQHGTILRTEDGGASWTEQPNLKAEEGSHLFAVHAIDANTAWAVGEWGTRILTRDGGNSWQDHSLAVSFDHPQYVWLDPADQERIRKGEKVYEDVGLNHIYCLPAPSQRCWLVGEFGYILYSDDLGFTWEQAEILGEIRMDPIEFGYDEIEIGEEDREKLAEFAARIADETHLNILVDPFVSPREVAEFGDPQDPYGLFDILEARIGETRAVLEDAGVLSDRLRMPNKPPWDYEDFQADDPAFLDRYLDSRNAEQPLVRVSVIQNPFLFNVHFRDEDNGLIAGLGGVILKSSDGGSTWRYQETDRKQAFFAVAESDGRAIAVGEKGMIRFSLDDGATWRQPAVEKFAPIFTFMRDLAFAEHEPLGFIVGQDGMVLRSRDSGDSWTQVLPPPGRQRRLSL